MIPSERTYAVTALIPKGKVLTYKSVGTYAQVSNPRVVGNHLHTNPYPGIIPCHRVINTQGRVAKTFAFGGGEEQKTMLEKEGVVFIGDKADLTSSLWQPTELVKFYWKLLFTYGFPGKWPWFGGKLAKSSDEIIIGAILTQNTNWRNVEHALTSLKNAGACSLDSIAKLGEEKLKELIKPSGYYNQKAKRLLALSKFISDNYKTLNTFFTLPTERARQELLAINGIGKETADTILLYAGNKPIFVIDAYTKCFCAFFKITSDVKYDELQRFFIQNLPSKIELFQDFHALIVQWGKERSLKTV